MSRSVLINLFGSRRKDHNYRRAGRSDPESRRITGASCPRWSTTSQFRLHRRVGLFNEGWGQFDAREIAAWLTTYDPTRPVDHASGWFDHGGRECKSLHVYFKTLPALPPDKRLAMVLSEFGGYTLNLEDHLWKPESSSVIENCHTRGPDSGLS